MDNIERLKKYINRVEGFLADMEEQMTANAGWLDVQHDSLKHH